MKPEYDNKAHHFYITWPGSVNDENDTAEFYYPEFLTDNSDEIVKRIYTKLDELIEDIQLQTLILMNEEETKNLTLSLILNPDRSTLFLLKQQIDQIILTKILEDYFEEFDTNPHTDKFNNL